MPPLVELRVKIYHPLCRCELNDIGACMRSIDRMTMIPRLKNACNSGQISNCYELCESQAVTIALPAHKVLLASIRPAKARTEHYLARLTTIKEARER